MELNNESTYLKNPLNSLQSVQFTSLIAHGKKRRCGLPDRRPQSMGLGGMLREVILRDVADFDCEGVMIQEPFNNRPPNVIS